MKNTPGTRGWSRLRDRTLAVTKNRAKITFFSGEKKLPKKNIFFCIYLLVMPKYWVKSYLAHGSFPEVGQKQKTEKNTPGTAGGPGGRDRMLAVKSLKNPKKSFHTWEISRSGSKEKDGEGKKRKKRLNDGNNNGQATHGARKPPGPISYGEIDFIIQIIYKYLSQFHAICVRYI